jgi:hypothetical protein
MTEPTPLTSPDQYAHLRGYAEVQKQATVDRLTHAIAKLEAEHRPVTAFTIKEVSGMDYMAYYRNREAFALFQQHSAHLRKKREKEHAKQSSSRRTSKQKAGREKEALHAVKVPSRDPLLDYKRPRLVALLREAQHERDALKQRVQEEKAELERCYRALLQDHMQCELKIARLEAERAEFQAFMERFRSSLKHEEHGS